MHANSAFATFNPAITAPPNPPDRSVEIYELTSRARMEIVLLNFQQPEGYHRMNHQQI